MTAAERKKVFRQIIVKCVLQLLLVETANELLCHVEVYERIPPASMLRLLAEVDNSYRFAKRFNADKELRMGLWKVGQSYFTFFSGNFYRFMFWLIKGLSNSL